MSCIEVTSRRLAWRWRCAHRAAVRRLELYGHVVLCRRWRSHRADGAHRLLKLPLPPTSGGS